MSINILKPRNAPLHIGPFELGRSSLDHLSFVIISLFHLLHGLFNRLRSLLTPLAELQIRIAMLQTLGSKFSAVVKCLIAFAFCRKSLYTLPSEK